VFSSCVYGTEAGACEASCSRKLKAVTPSRVLAFPRCPRNVLQTETAASIKLRSQFLCSVPLALQLGLGCPVVGGYDSKPAPEAARLNLAKLVDMLEC